MEPNYSEAEKAVMRAYRNRLVRKGYSPNTQRVYCNNFKDFCLHFNVSDLGELTTEQINGYLPYLIKAGNISSSQQNQRINAIKFFYEKILGREKQYYEFYHPRKEFKLPKVLSKNKIKRMMESFSQQHIAAAR